MQKQKLNLVRKILNAKLPNRYAYFCKGCEWAVNVGENLYYCPRICKKVHRFIRLQKRRDLTKIK